MPSRWITQSDFTSGELDPRGLGRRDLERFPSSLALARNVSIDKLGSLRTRGGWRWVDDVPNSARVQLRGWQRGDDDYLLVIAEDSNLYVYDSSDTLIATLEGGATDGFVISVLFRNDAATVTPSNHDQTHVNTGSSAGATNAFGRIEPPLTALAEPGWTWSGSSESVIISTLVSGAGDPLFAVDADTFEDTNVAAASWTVSHTFDATANLVLALLSFERNNATPVTSVVIDPAGDNVALSELETKQEGGIHTAAVWGAFDATGLTSGAKDVVVTFNGGNASGAAEIITFIAADRLPEAQDIASDVQSSVSGISVDLAVPDAGFGPSSVGEIDSASDSKTMLLFHEDVESQWLRLDEVTDTWIFEPFPIEDYPYHRFQAPGVTMAPSGITGNITLTTSEDHWLPSHVGSIVRFSGDHQLIEVTGFVSATVVEATVLEDDLGGTGAIVTWDERVWSEGRGWPISGCWHQGRLVIGGARDLQDGFWVSKVGSVEDVDGISFDLGTVADDEAIWARIRADEGVNIEYVRSQGPLLILASGTEWIVPQQPLTPTDISFDRQASQGVARLKPADLDGAIIYLRSARAGEGEEGEQPIIHFAWDELSQRYQASDISVLSQHLLDNPIDMAAARGSTSDANNVLYLANSDGSVAALHLPSIERPGMTLYEGDLSIYSVTVAAGKLYGAAEYNGAHRIFRLDPDSNLDASATFEIASSTTVGTFAWLANQLVTVKGFTATGWTIQTATADGSGVVTVTTAVTKGEVGLPFEWRMRLLTPEAADATVGSLKSPVEARIMVKDTLAIEIGDEDGRVPMTLEDGSTPGDLTTDPATGHTGFLRDHLQGGWSEEPIIEMGSAQPWPATVLVANAKVEF